MLTIEQNKSPTSLKQCLLFFENDYNLHNYNLSVLVLVLKKLPLWQNFVYSNSFRLFKKSVSYLLEIFSKVKGDINILACFAVHSLFLV